MKPLHLSLGLVLLSSLQRISSSSVAPPQQQVNAQAADSSQKQHSIQTVCHATRAVYDHFGKVAKWQAHCRVEIWAGKDQPVFPDLTPEKVLKNGITSLPPPQSKIYEQNEPEALAQQQILLQQQQQQQHNHQMNMNELLQAIQFLVDEARLRHHECMESKSTLMHNLQQQLPPTLSSKEAVLAQLNGIDVNLPPNVGLYIGHMDSFMKEKVAELHAIENNSKLTADQKKEALKAKRIEIRGYLDGHCQQAHPSIAHHEISTAVPADLHDMKVSLLLRQPGNQVEIMHLPTNAFEQRTELLKTIAGAALHHSSSTGEIGNFEVHSSAPWDPVEERSIRTLAGHNYYGPYQRLFVPRTLIVKGLGDNEVVPGVKSATAGASSGVSTDLGTGDVGRTTDATNMIDAVAHESKDTKAEKQQPTESAQSIVSSHSAAVKPPVSATHHPAAEKKGTITKLGDSLVSIFTNPDRDAMKSALTMLLVANPNMSREDMMAKAEELAAKNQNSALELINQYYERQIKETNAADKTFLKTKETKAKIKQLQQEKGEDINKIKTLPSAPPEHSVPAEIVGQPVSLI